MGRARARERRRPAADSHHTRDTVVRKCAPRFSHGDIGLLLLLACPAKRRRGGTHTVHVGKPPREMQFSTGEVISFLSLLSLSFFLFLSSSRRFGKIGRSAASITLSFRKTHKVYDSVIYIFKDVQQRFTQHLAR